MSAFATFSAGIAIIGWCLVHFVWQAACVGALYAVARALLPRGNPRYVAAVLALLVLAVCPVATAWHEWNLLVRPLAPAGVVVLPMAAAEPAGAAVGPPWRAVLALSLPWLVLAWAACVAVLGARVFRQWLKLRTLLREASGLPEWQARARQFCARLGRRRAVPILASVRVAVPTVVGWVKPAVVLPVAIVARMPVAQVELVLAHELAHLRRFDHLANLFQLVLETLFFYHPVVHWISRDARHERELCCDALALRATDGDRREFVAALASLAEFRTSRAGLALAANGGALAERAWFIAGARPPARRARAHLATLLVLLAVLAGTGALWRQGMVRQRIGEALARNAVIVRQGLASIATGSLPAYQDVPMRRPVLAPLGAVVKGAGSEPALPTFPRVPLVVVPLQPPNLPALPALAQRVPQSAAPVNHAGTTAALPHVIRSVRPAYPPAALAEGLEGQVEVEFTLGAAGVPEHLRVVRSTSAALDAASLAALSRWRFSPPAAAQPRYRQTFTFRLGAEGANGAATHGCLILTGSHICRYAFDAAPGIRALRPAR